MAFRTILSVTGPEQGESDLRLAADLCDSSGAHLSILVMALAAPPPIGEYAVMVSDAWFEERQADMEDLGRRTAAVTAFLAGRETAGDVADEYSEVALADDVIGRRARYADLTVIGPEMLGSDTLGAKVVEGALFWSARPLLVVPQGHVPTLQPSRVMVAWDASLEASAAVGAALEVLRGAEEVRIALVDPVEGENAHGAEPGADLAAYLARHGVEVRVDRLAGGGRPPAEALRRHAVDMAAQLLVMGAYGHSRLRERIFGGVTRSMIEEPPLPVLMAR